MAALIRLPLAALVLGVLAASAADQPTLPRVQVSADGKHFVLAGTKTVFRPWGANYGNDNRLLEDVWEKDWPTLEGDFRELKALGANVVRVHLQFGKFMDAADRPNAAALERLGKLLELATKTELYLDITGLGSYRKADVPAWYDALDEAGRWAAQARFWAAVAQRCNGNPAVFCYDLMNEPVVPSGKRGAGEWLSGKPLGGYDFVQFISLEQGDRQRPAIAVQWIKTLKAAIRKHDAQTLITVGQLPTIPKWGHFSGFVPEKVAPELDFISVHIYPEKDKKAEALATLREFAVVGKPLVIEEIFPLKCSPAELKAFMLESRGIACGWIGHYDGLTLGQYDELKAANKLTLPQALWREWLVLFRDLRAELVEK